MAFGRTDDITSIHSYEQAVKVWDEAEEFRHEHTSWRALASKRMPHKRIVKQTDGGYACVLYSTAMVVYYPDHVELACDGRSMSNGFSWRVCPTGTNPTGNGGDMFWQINTAQGTRFYREGRKRLRLKELGNGKWALMNEPATDFEWVYDPKLGAAARKLLKPYDTWYATSKRLGLQLTDVASFIPNYHERAIEKLLEAPDDVETIAETAQTIGDPFNARAAAYLHLGARYQVAAPFDRLPRRT
jgi:hypothetical protein